MKIGKTILRKSDGFLLTWGCHIDSAIIFTQLQSRKTSSENSLCMFLVVSAHLYVRCVMSSCWISVWNITQQSSAYPHHLTYMLLTHLTSDWRFVFRVVAAIVLPHWEFPGGQWHWLGLVVQEFWGRGKWWHALPQVNTLHVTIRTTAVASQTTVSWGLDKNISSTTMTLGE